MILLLAAEGEEAAALRRRLKDKRRVRGPFPCHRGSFAGKAAVVVETHPGKTPAAAATAWAITAFRPRAAFFAGVAGALAPGLQQGDLLVGLEAVQWDVDLTLFGRKPGELATGERFVPADPGLSKLLARTTGARLGRIASGDRFVADRKLADWIRSTFEADAVEMEGAAALWTARRMGVPMGLLRVVSDLALETAEVAFAVFLLEGSERMANALEQALARLK